MTFEDYWIRLCKGTPNLRQGDNRMSMSVYEFRRMGRKLFEAGCQLAKDTWKAAEEFGGVKNPDPISDLFRSILGRDKG